MSLAKAVTRPSVAADLLDLTKPRLSSLIVITAGVGLVLPPGGPPPLWKAVATLAGTAAVVGGANALNCYRERVSDRTMRRTRGRPLPAGRLEPQAALAFGALLALLGTACLLVIEPLAGLLAALAVGIYVFAYTPLKRVTPLCTLVGAIPGAIPTLIGWVAASGRLDAGAWVFFSWLYLWQPPHFLALGTLYREDYAAAGMPMLPVRYPDSGIVERQMAFYTAALVPIPLLLLPLSRAGALTGALAPILGVLFLAVALSGQFTPDRTLWARRAFLASIAYLSLSLLVMVIDASVGA